MVLPPKDPAKGVEISSSPVAPSLARGFSLSFPSSSGSLQGMPSPRQNTPQPLDFDRLVPFNYERQHDAPSEKRSKSPSPHPKESSRESSLAPHALEHGTAFRQQSVASNQDMLEATSSRVQQISPSPDGVSSQAAPCQDMVGVITESSDVSLHQNVASGSAASSNPRPAGLAAVQSIRIRDLQMISQEVVLKESLASPANGTATRERADIFQRSLDAHKEGREAGLNAITDAMKDRTQGIAQAGLARTNSNPKPEPCPDVDQFKTAVKAAEHGMLNKALRNGYVALSPRTTGAETPRPPMSPRPAGYYSLLGLNPSPPPQSHPGTPRMHTRECATSTPTTGTPPIHSRSSSPRINTLLPSASFSSPRAQVTTNFACAPSPSPRVADVTGKDGAGMHGAGGVLNITATDGAQAQVKTQVKTLVIVDEPLARPPPMHKDNMVLHVPRTHQLDAPGALAAALAAYKAPASPAAQEDLFSPLSVSSDEESPSSVKSRLSVASPLSQGGRHVWQKTPSSSFPRAGAEQGDRVGGGGGVGGVGAGEGAEVNGGGVKNCGGVEDGGGVGGRVGATEDASDRRLVEVTGAAGNSGVVGTTADAENGTSGLEAPTITARHSAAAGV